MNSALPGQARPSRQHLDPKYAPLLVPHGLARLVYSSRVSALPPQARAEERAFWSTASHYRSLRTSSSNCRPLSPRRRPSRASAESP
jgi:hypothetical protein